MVIINETINNIRYIFLQKYLELRLYTVFHLNQENYDLIMETLYMIYANSRYIPAKIKLSSKSIKIIIKLVIKLYHKSVSNDLSANKSIIINFF